MMQKALKISIVLLMALVGIPGSINAQDSVFESFSEVAQNSASSFELIQTLGRGTANVAAWSPEGETLAVGGLLGIWLYSNNYQDATFLEGHPKNVYLLAWSPDGTRLASVSEDITNADQEIMIWDVEQDNLITVLRGHSDAIQALAWSPDGRFLASGSGDNTIRLWDIADWSSEVLTGHSSVVTSLAWNPSPNEFQLLSGSHDATARLWDVVSGQEIRNFAMVNEVLAVAWSPDSTRIGVGGSDVEIKIWDVATGILSSTLSGLPSRVETMTWSSTGNRIIAGGRQLAIWDPLQSEPLYVLNEGSRNIRVRPNSSEFVGINNNLVGIYDAATGTHTTTLLAHAYFFSVVFWASPDTLYSSGNGIRVWNIADQQLITFVPISILWAKWNADQSLLAGGGTEDLRIFDWSQAIHIPTGELMQGGPTPVTPLATPSGHYSSNDIAWSPDNTRFASVSEETPYLRIARTSDWQFLEALQGNIIVPNLIDWASNSNLLAVGGYNENVEAVIEIWDMSDSTPEVVITDTSPAITALAWSSDGDVLAFANHVAQVMLWDRHTQTTTILPGNTARVTSLAWTPDGLWLAGGSGDEIYIWNMTNLELVPPIHANQDIVVDVAWSPDSAKLASAGNNGTIKIWGQSVP